MDAKDNHQNGEVIGPPTLVLQQSEM
jgi:hypothetical protein